MAASTADRILDAAEARFSARGFSATSLGDIADEVGIRTPSLYKHFSSKKELYAAVMARLIDPFVELLNEILATPTDERDATANLEAVVDYYLRHPNLARLVQHAALAGGDEMELLVDRWVAPLLRRSAELTVGAPFFEGKSPIEAMQVVMAFHSLLVGYVTLAPLHSRLMGADFLEADALTRQKAFMRRIIGTLWVR